MSQKKYLKLKNAYFSSVKNKKMTQLFREHMGNNKVPELN